MKIDYKIGDQVRILDDCSSRTPVTIGHKYPVLEIENIGVFIKGEKPNPNKVNGGWFMYFEEIEAWPEDKTHSHLPTDDAESFFLEQSYSNKWLTELTPTEHGNLIDMLNEFKSR